MGTSTLAERMKEALEASGMSQRKLSLAGGQSQSFVGKVIRGELRSPGAAALEAIARAAGVDYAWLATGNAAASPPRPESRYPARDVVVAAARARGIDPAAIAALESVRLKEGSGEETVEFWVEQLALMRELVKLPAFDVKGDDDA